MAAPFQPPQTAPVGPETLISIKVLFKGYTRRFKLPLRELGASSLPQKVRQLLTIPDDANVTLERYSDSAGSYVVLDSENISVYKQLYRAAKAKLKLRIKVTLAPEPAPEPQPLSVPPQSTDAQQEQPQQRCSYLETVLRVPTDGFVNQNDYPASGSSPPPPLNPAMFPSVPDDSPAGVDNQIPPQAEPQRDTDLVQSNPVSTAGDMCAAGPNLNQLSPICIDCNHCGERVPDAHYHCSICDDGDYDLCQKCIDAGVLCPGEGHWLIKRTVNDGRINYSVTETIAPRKYHEPEPQEELNNTEKHITSMEVDEMRVRARTCNACFRDFNEKELVTCQDCPDYDLCFTCLLEDRHGHHPGHSFSLIVDGEFQSKGLVMSTCQPGRGRYHAAICDGCNKVSFCAPNCLIVEFDGSNAMQSIKGVRHKCLNCPDWDYCSKCIMNAPEFHPGHRFAPLYTPIPEPHDYRPTHYGVICDGPLCSVSSKPVYIRGIRYKCAVCHDTDFCGNCEAHPDNTHNRTHPLIKFKTPVRNATVTTFNNTGGGGESAVTLGDQPVTKSTSTETVAPSKSNAATQVQTEKADTDAASVADSDAASEADSTTAQPSVKDDAMTSRAELSSTPSELRALFVRDTIPDGSRLAPNKTITQTWTLYNPGPAPWPKGCSVRFVGGDSMFNVDTNHPSSLSNLVSAMESQELTIHTPAGAFADFTIELKTPRREGRAISYWRLKTPDGRAFGHKLWCDIDVRASAEEMETLPEQTADNKQSSVETEKSSVESRTEAGDAEVSQGESQSESAMIFPKLETESPSASIEKSVSPKVPAANELEVNHDLADDVESLTLDGNSTEDDFLTDEEYDILDASDQEFSPEAQRADRT
ncbi:ZZ type zinc finger domain-containing protein [Blastomyces dermatitidis ER-3]|uniref:ZZ type zinc finger domain-containing protein n=1 Tax=Ajellomyces dermatitidis (strain ER-3 / ATCC MYA-2586) TaxID=559297 RepID=A0ABP2F0R9_AJEDR|nr:ZZ type zinc finger domain-containing protein [Blastomyces dermatitidis ER-3]EEQ90269.2 ZZ type zinc finger domain-containing protein [Blastomyces dermatitidis ER-3]